MSLLEFDPEKLIEEVKKRPCIWDTNRKDHKRWSLRRKAWSDITRVFNTTGDQSPTFLKELEKELGTKWRSLKDAYIKDVKYRKRTEKGEAPPKKHPYIYSKSMQFLLQAQIDDIVESKSESDSELPLADRMRYRKICKFRTKRSVDEDTKEGDPLTTRASCSRSIKPKNDMINLNEILSKESIEPNTINESDTEKLFALSLVEPLKKIPEHLRFGVRIEIMKVIQNALNHNNCNLDAQYKLYE